MADVYSLICWGGRLGKSVTVNASTDLVTLTRHGVRQGMGVAFVSGTLPTVAGTALALNTTYYTKWIAQDTFELYYDSALTSKINFTSTGASLVMKSAYLLGLSDLSRWGDAGSERIYDSVSTWISGRTSGASPYNVEVAEVGESFTDQVTAMQTFSIPSAQNILTTTIGGIRTAAWHGGNYPPATPTANSGYEIYITNDTSTPLIQLNRYRDKIDGIIIRSGNYSTVAGVKMDAGQTEVSGCFFVTSGSGVGYGRGIQHNAPLIRVLNNVIVGWNAGIFCQEYLAGTFTANNLVSGCTTGFWSGASTNGFYYNNIAIGNTTNWMATFGAIEGADKNAGLSGEAWIKGAGTRLTIATTDFQNYAGKDFRPASASSPQVETGVQPYGIATVDIKDAVRPAYMNGAAAYFDVGPYEYDHGYGPWPASATISLTSIVSGSRVLITKASDGTVLYNDVPGTSLSFNTTHIGDFNVVVRKATASPFYREFNASGTTVADQTTSIKCLQQLDE